MDQLDMTQKYDMHINDITILPSPTPGTSIYP